MCMTSRRSPGSRWPCLTSSAKSRSVLRTDRPLSIDTSDRAGYAPRPSMLVKDPTVSSVNRCSAAAPDSYSTHSMASRLTHRSVTASSPRHAAAVRSDAEPHRLRVGQGTAAASALAGEPAEVLAAHVRVLADVLQQFGELRRVAVDHLLVGAGKIVRCDGAERGPGAAHGLVADRLPVLLGGLVGVDVVDLHGVVAGRDVGHGATTQA